jgi:hypothetical protein
LRKKRKQQAPAILLISVSEVEVKVPHGSQSSIAQSHDILNDRRANRQLQLSEAKTYGKRRTKGRSSRSPLETSFVRSGMGKQ